MRSFRRPIAAFAVFALLLGCGTGNSEHAREALPPAPGSRDGAAPAVQTVPVKVIDASGKLVGPVQSPKVVKTDEAWRAELSPASYQVARKAGTERANTGPLLRNKDEGVYTCTCCGLPLFGSDSKFESGTGWPSFFEPIAQTNVTEIRDASHGMTRVEIVCSRCDAHLGHVFDDGPRPTGLRYCMNSVSMAFTPKEKLAMVADPIANKSPAPQRAEVVFAGGCFWCVEAVFEELDGVIDAESGYAGGSSATANYKDVCSGATGHAEVVRIVYDPTKISYGDLMRVHFSTHNPTTLNRQGADTGTQYRSAIFYSNEEERAIAAEYIDTLNKSKVFPQPVVTTLEPLEKFYPAEAYHQNYACENPDQGYVRAVALPKVEKVRKEFKDMLKKQPEPHK